jgi:hypothetical protein
LNFLDEQVMGLLWAVPGLLGGKLCFFTDLQCSPDMSPPAGFWKQREHLQWARHVRHTINATPHSVKEKVFFVQVTASSSSF